MTFATATAGPYRGPAPVTPGELVAAAVGLLGAGGIGGWLGNTLRTKIRAGVDHRSIAADASKEDHRHDEVVMQMLVDQGKRNAEQMDRLQLQLDVSLREEGELKAKFSALSERCVGLEKQLDQVQKRNELLETENIRLRDQVTKLTARVGDLRLELERHGVKCPEHMNDAPADLPAVTAAVTVRAPEGDAK